MTITDSRMRHPAFANLSAVPSPSSVAAVNAPRGDIYRGDIWFVDASSTDSDLGSHRSVGCEIWSNKLAVVISNDRMNQSSGFVQVVYLSTAKTRTPTRLHPTVSLPSQPDNADEAVAFCEQIHTIDVSRLRAFKGGVRGDQLAAIGEALHWTLGFDADHTIPNKKTESGN